MDRRPRKQTTVALTLRVALVSGLATAVLLAGLVWQTLAGADPALQPTPVPASQPSNTAVSADAGGSGGASSGGGAAITSSRPAPIVTAPAPVTSSTS